MKTALTAIISFLAAVALTATTLWFAQIKEHQATIGKVDSVCRQQVATWQRLTDDREAIIRNQTHYEDLKELVLDLKQRIRELERKK